MTVPASYGLAALCFAGLLAWRLGQPLTRGPRAWLLAAYAITVVWAVLSAVAGVVAPETILAGTLRNLAWLAMLLAMTRQIAREHKPEPGLTLVFMAEFFVLAAQLVLNSAAFTGGSVGELLPTILQTSRMLRIVTASGALIIIHNLYGQAAPSSRVPIRSAMFALTMMWAYDLNLFTFAYFGSPLAEPLFVWRGLIVAATMPLLAMSDMRGDGWRLKLSRAATFQSLSLVAICCYLAAMTVFATALRGSSWGGTRTIASGAVGLLTLTALIAVSSARMRAWAKVKFAKHFFEHRYDYRTEWLRFTGTIGRSGVDAAPLGQRVIQAFADILEAPGGLLLVSEESGAIDCSAAWNWPGKPIPAGESPASIGFWPVVESEGRVIDLDAVRGGWTKGRDRAVAVPAWMTDDVQAWVAVPLIHHDRLVGIVLLAAPDYRRSLDWEDFDLLRTAGRQAASSLAEAHGQEALLNAQRFEEFNRRFAFILHDVKNLVSQLSLLSRNAERHADNPEFRADMVATLKSSVGKMNELLLRLAPQAGQRSERAEAMPLRDLLSATIAAKRRAHDVRLLGDTGLWAMIDPVGLEQAVGHLMQNAIDASPPDRPVTVRVTGDGGDVAIAIIDQGSGMDGDFIRHRLFQPFASTKQSGFGVGAFEARSLIAAMGGRLTVASTPGKGSQFTIHLAAVEAAPERKIA